MTRTLGYARVNSSATKSISFPSVTDAEAPDNDVASDNDSGACTSMAATDSSRTGPSSSTAPFGNLNFVVPERVLVTTGNSSNGKRKSSAEQHKSVAKKKSTLAANAARALKAIQKVPPVPNVVKSLSRKAQKAPVVESIQTDEDGFEQDYLDENYE